jgi:glycogen operon protein
MLLAGDEFARTQHGNNNVYAIDGPTSWVDWNLSQRGTAQVEFTKKLTALRAKYPILRRTRFLTGEHDDKLGVKDVTWIGTNGLEMSELEWNDEGTRCFGMLIDGRARPSGLEQLGTDATLLIVFNAHFDMVNFALPQAVGGTRWELLVDTNIARESEITDFNAGDVYEVTARSLLLFLLKTA